MYKTGYFTIQELVPRSVYESHSEQRLWQFLDERLLRGIDKIREKFGACIVNDWGWNGRRQQAGFRPPDSTIGARYSQHKFGRAVDIVFPSHFGVSHFGFVQHVVGMLTHNPFLAPEITTIESGVNWLHVDTRNVEVDPKGNQRYIIQGD